MSLGPWTRCVSSGGWHRLEERPQPQEALGRVPLLLPRALTALALLAVPEAPSEHRAGLLVRRWSWDVPHPETGPRASWLPLKRGAHTADVARECSALSLKWIYWRTNSSKTELDGWVRFLCLSLSLPPFLPPLPSSPPPLLSNFHAHSCVHAGLWVSWRGVRSEDPCPPQCSF